jgi:hypothetical protein
MAQKSQNLMEKEFKVKSGGQALTSAQGRGIDIFFQVVIINVQINKTKH